MESTPRKRRPFWMLILVCLLAGGFGFGLYYLYEVDQWPTPVTFKYILLACLGVLTGLTARISLRKHTGMFRFFSAAFAAVVGMWVLDWRSGGFIGIAPIDLDHPYPGWDGILQLATAWGVMILTLRAWKRKQLPAPVPVPAPAPARPAPEPQPRFPLPRPATGPQLQTAGGPAEIPSDPPKSISEALAPIIGQLKTWPALGRPVQKSAGPVPRHLPQPALEITPPVVREPVLIPTRPNTQDSRVKLPTYESLEKKKPRRKKKSNAQVKLVGAEDHRCPFCLEEINQHDPRGVKICPICKTYHHADCWDITGVCQVPHHQA